MQGIIIKNISNDYVVKTKEKLYTCKARGKFRKEKITPLVGDNCIFDETKNYITELLPRRTELKKPPVANIDQAFIITSVKEPDLELNLLDKLLCIIEYNNITPVICFTKLDLLEDKTEIENIMNYYKNIGYKVFKNTELDEIKKQFKDRITVFTGQSGAGKSTLLNKLNKNLNLKTNEISIALGRGKHTTRHVELIEMLDGLIADTPGFSSLSFIGMKNEEIRDNFIEFNNYRHLCEYKDCMHESEENCEIKKQLKEENILKTRYENYIKFIKRWNMLSVSILGIKENIKENIKKLDNLNIDYFHIDIMDGKFVKNKTWKYKEIKNILENTTQKKDIHLMVKNVKKYIKQYKKLNPEIITFHYEATKKHKKYIEYIKKNNIKAGLSIKPNTKVDEIKHLLKDLDLVLVMSVEPGAGGQKYIENSGNKINELKELKEKYNYNYLIEVDGGINNETKEKAKNADILVVGSYITNNNYEEKIKEFK